ncbi:MAG: UDP-N-acetylmuramate--L-alanine ligase [Parcubacteria group bacterium]|nr:UDP-N-acetylmuramate--L-alanine ligase [Parcubacteria group bacterium]
MSFDVKKVKKAHFIGIGGIGMSALAQLFLHEGAIVTGSDREPSPVTELLERKGIGVSFEQRESNVPADVDVVVYTAAISEDNPELMRARTLSVPVLNYFETLGTVSKGKLTIAISGTHGKTTTTGMIAEIFIRAGHKPTVIVGSLLKKYGSNFVPGESDLFIVEACEHKRHFLHLHPAILVITNIEEDHLDFYKNLENIKQAFHELASKVPKGGFVVSNANDQVVMSAVGDINASVIDYAKMDVNTLSLNVPGEHNKKNAQAALGAVSAFNKMKQSTPIAESAAREALSFFVGTWRRFEYKGETSRGALVYDDYAHHPTAIKATLKTARAQFPSKRIIAVFHPHLYSRTKLLFNDFAKSFEDADEVLIAPIYAAREEEDPSINAHVLAEAVGHTGKQAHGFSDLQSVGEYLKQNTGRETVVFTIGAGDIYKIAEELIMS